MTCPILRARAQSAGIGMPSSTCFSVVFVEEELGLAPAWSAWPACAVGFAGR